VVPHNTPKTRRFRSVFALEGEPLTREAASKTDENDSLLPHDASSAPWSSPPSLTALYQLGIGSEWGRLVLEMLQVVLITPPPVDEEAWFRFTQATHGTPDTPEARRARRCLLSSDPVA